MKITFGKKLILFFHWLLSLVLAALAVCLCLWPDLVQGGVALVNRWLGAQLAGVLGIVILCIYALLAAMSVATIFSNPQKRSERGFITVDSSDAGRTRIAVGAVDQMIRQAVRSVDGIVEMKSGITNCEDAISISAAVTIVSGAHIPTVTMNIQRAIRSYIELNCGVAVRDVSVSVNALEGGESDKHSRRKGFAAVHSAPSAQKSIPASAEAEAKQSEIEICENSQPLPEEAAEEAVIAEEMEAIPEAEQEIEQSDE